MARDSLLDINDILEEYSVEVQDGIINEAIKIAKDGVSELKKTSPKKTGDYAKGWKTNNTKGRGYVDCVIHNNKKPYLTHLLERPRLDRTGTKTIKPKSAGHIKAVEEKCIKKYESNVIKIIENGG